MSESDTGSTKPGPGGAAIRRRRRRRALRVPVDEAPQPSEQVTEESPEQSVSADSSATAEPATAEPATEDRPSEPTTPMRKRERGAKRRGKASSRGATKATAASRTRGRPATLRLRPSQPNDTIQAPTQTEEDAEATLAASASANVEPELDTEDNAPPSIEVEIPTQDDPAELQDLQEPQELAPPPNDEELATEGEGVAASAMVAIGDSNPNLSAPRQARHISEPPPGAPQDASATPAASPGAFDEDTQRLSSPDLLEVSMSDLGAAGAKPPPPPPAPATPPARPGQAGSPPTPAVKMWFEELFDRDYLRTVPPPTPRQVARECDFIEARLELTEGARILDVGCGLGLHAVELGTRGYQVVGVDISAAMLRQALAEAEDRGGDATFEEMDMRSLGFDEEFDAILSWHTSFGYFDDDANRGVLDGFYQALKPGGRLLIDVVNRDHGLGQHPNLVWFEGDDCVCMEETAFNYISSRLQVKRTVILQDSRQLQHNYSLRLYSLHELGQLLHHQGFRVAEVSGIESTPGAFLGCFSARMIILAERRLGTSEPTTAAVTRPSEAPPDTEPES